MGISIEIKILSQTDEQIKSYAIDHFARQIIEEPAKNEALYDAVNKALHKDKLVQLLDTCKVGYVEAVLITPALLDEEDAESIYTALVKYEEDYTNEIIKSNLTTYFLNKIV